MAFNKIARTKRVRLARVALSASALFAMAIPVTFVSEADAKTPGKTYCYYGKCHRVKTIEETRALVGKEEAVTASHYDDCSRDRYNPCGLTSSGEKFHPDRADNTASPIYPDGTTLLVWSPDSGRALVVRVNNAGPYWGNRTLDLSKAVAEKLGLAGQGVADLKVKVIKEPEPADTVYAKERSYPPVPGDIGQYASLEEAGRGTAVALAFQAASGSPLAPVTTANAFAGAGTGTGMLVAEAPQVLGRSVTHVAYSRRELRSQSLAFGGFTTGVAPQSHPPLAMMSAKQAKDEGAASKADDRSLAPAQKPVTGNSAVTAEVKPVESKPVVAAAAMKEAAGDADETKPTKKQRLARNDDDDKSAKRNRSSSKVARNNGSRNRESTKARVAYADERYVATPRYTSTGYGEGGARSVQQTTFDNMRPL